MTPTIGCESARPFLEELVDNELALEDAVRIEGHLRMCDACAARVEDYHAIGRALRGAAPPTRAEGRALDTLQASVLGRVLAERGQSFGVWVRRAFEDYHVVTAAVGAIVGVIACVLSTAAIISSVDARTADSLAATIDVLSRPGSDENPLLLDGRMSPPRLSIPRYFDDSPEMMRIPEDDAVFAFAAVVSREGKLADYEFLGGQHPPHDAMRSVLATLRFAPAQAGGSPVAVNMVWLLARTTVKGTPRPFDFDLERPPSRRRG